MTIQKTKSEDKETIVMQKNTKPLHVRIVSMGAFLLLSITILILVNLLTTALAGYIAQSLVMLPEAPTVLATQGILYIGLGCLALSLGLLLTGRKIYAHRSGRILQKVLIATACFLTYFALGLGAGLIFTFVFFLWAPRFTVDWDERQLKIYRIVVIMVIGGQMFAESVLTSGMIGISLVPKVLTLSLVQFIPAEFAWIAFVGAAFVVPLYLLLPSAFQTVWNMRPNIESFWREFLYHPMGIIGLAIISAIVLIGLLAPVLAPYGWGEGSLQLEDLLQPPSAEHWLGTNHRGEDIFSRILYGSQISLLVGFAASIVAVFMGTSIGLVAGYYGGFIDTILMRITDVFLCLPTLPLMLIFLVLFGQGIQNVIIVIAILGWTGTARMVRSEALSLRERPLTEAAHALGASDSYILIKHIMPNTLPLILANMILGVVNAILNEAGIAFLGFVDIHGQPSWGVILHWAWNNAALLSNRWWWFIPPGLLIMLTTLGFVFISHTADKVVNPRLRGRRG
ncbi:MAG: hypothetical protein DRO87_07405 [Candidatus Thorarchaeota archaeon]|nr:MAG: hypothetical protein DRO87_07405 [Candidatus Thorarchaeota archaeon]